MSAWLVGNNTLSLCVDVIKSDDFKPYDTGNYAAKSKEELIDILSDLNTKSLNCRYGENPSHILKNRGYTPLDVEDGQRHKSVACYLYQTCECPEIVKHSLFDSLLKWEEDNFEKYLNGNYQWDIDNPIGVK